MNIKGLFERPFIQAELLVQPAFNFGGTVLGFPLLQRLVISAFGFNHLSGVRVLIDLELARLALASCCRP